MSIETNGPRCQIAQGDDLVSKYLSDKLSPEKAEAFEEHYFRCDACWQELEAALAVRAAIASNYQLGQKRTRSPLAVPATKYAASVGVLVAAGLAAVTFMTVFRQADGPDNGVDYRVQRTALVEVLAQDVHSDRLSSVSFLTRESGGQAGVFFASWPAVPQAEAYILKLHAADGTLVHEQMIRATSLSVPLDSLLRAALETELSGQAVFGSIEAVRMETSEPATTLYRVVAHSPPVRITVLQYREESPVEPDSQRM